MNWHGQFDPPVDAIIAGYFNPDYRGFAIDVGAADGEIISNTKAFEDSGWTILCIEPNPEFWPSLTTKRKHCQQYAVAESDGTTTLKIYSGPGSGHDAVSSIKPDRRLVEQYSVKLDKEVQVQQRTLDSCVNECGLFKRIDFVSIDTEGTELDVLKGFSIARWKPRLFVVENNYNDENIHDYMTQHGYRLDRRHVVNEFYVPLN